MSEEGRILILIIGAIITINTICVVTVISEKLSILMKVFHEKKPQENIK